MCFTGNESEGKTEREEWVKEHNVCQQGPRLTDNEKRHERESYGCDSDLWIHHWTSESCAQPEMKQEPFWVKVKVIIMN